MSVESNHTQYLRKLGIDVWQPRVDASFFPAAPVTASPQDSGAPIEIDEPIEPVAQPKPEMAYETIEVARKEGREEARQEAREETKDRPKEQSETEAETGQPFEQAEIVAELKFDRHFLYQFSNLCLVLIEADPTEVSIPTDQNRVLVGILRSVGIVSQTDPVVSSVESLMEVTIAVQHNNNSNLPMFCFSENIQSEMFSSAEYQAELFFKTTLEKLVRYPNEKIELWNRVKNIDLLIYNLGDL